ncbi:ATP-dependent Clp protease adapter protein ClpS [Tetrabaena socialis]|uniref:ATP-dependent Clp protease adapter protein ClpS n=1 Tax=Tetrabaena socialis TaxID=47790 RepID=A0A2J8A3I2_9CHLO|nr:ATP-dependent Clp protease adapter protein ClpS [Tetrabaena socialis]|eukprot:PNH07087.1 ATP-dependent Clp protease adapter protein ClpS [Tetrabaena socialis]
MASVLRASPVGVFASQSRARGNAACARPACLGWHRAIPGVSPQTTRTRCTRLRATADVIEKTSVSTPEKGTDKSPRPRPPMYKLMLHNDAYNKREYVVKVLLKIVTEITLDDAVVVMQRAHEAGVAVVVACPQDSAERYCEGLRLNGLTCTIEPGGC